MKPRVTISFPAGAPLRTRLLLTAKFFWLLIRINRASDAEFARFTALAKAHPGITVRTQTRIG